MEAPEERGRRAWRGSGGRSPACKPARAPRRRRRAPDCREGGEEGGAGAEDDGDLARLDAAPGGEALGVGEVGVEDGDSPVAEALAQAGNGLGGEGDLRERRRGFGARCLQGLGGGAEIDLGLSGAGDAEEEEVAGLAGTFYGLRRWRRWRACWIAVGGWGFGEWGCWSLSRWSTAFEEARGRGGHLRVASVTPAIALISPAVRPRRSASCIFMRTRA